MIKTVAIKFCGGCNPSFDRVSYWNRMQAAAAGQIRWVSPDDPNPDAVLLLCGCETACPGKTFDHLTGSLRVILVRDAGQAPEEIAQRLMGDDGEENRD